MCCIPTRPRLRQSLDTLRSAKDPNMKSERRIVVGMSGGVDSSVAAWLLKQQGYEVIGLFMKNWEDDDDDEYCSSRQDWLDAAGAAARTVIAIAAVKCPRADPDGGW